MISNPKIHLLSFNLLAKYFSLCATKECKMKNISLLSWNGNSCVSKFCILRQYVRSHFVNFQAERNEWLINFVFLRIESESDTHINLRLCRDFDHCVGYIYLEMLRWVVWHVALMKMTMKCVYSTTLLSVFGSSWYLRSAIEHKK